ncbi:hypothetical protein DKT77_03475 [Meridianimarinicoccus roseus]|uniref:Uncharacterized protein n=1 Tax=Meridianimarinicoccus roseus TaxID=2072018 RepID=A0A2V2LJ83_9RHOB|nr:hypothetical protein [Meridianimarinicoccus roseus]PWR04111.1 hypothetical protein DKT77_03475 [Meridianimarinicoccus roseus]
MLSVAWRLTGDGGDFVTPPIGDTKPLFHAIQRQHFLDLSITKSPKSLHKKRTVMEIYNVFQVREKRFTEKRWDYVGLFPAFRMVVKWWREFGTLIATLYAVRFWEQRMTF